MLNPFKKKYTESELEVFDFLSNVRYFEGLSHSELERFLPAIHYRKYVKDEVVFFSNDPSGAIYIIKQGKVKLTIDIKDDFETIMNLEEPACFGENALLEDKKRLYTAIIASEQAELMVFPSYAIQEVFANNSQIKSKMITSLAEYYNDNNLRMFKSYKSSFGFFNLSQMFE
ncbi:cyclic nucleotide-binding domain-containing protein [Litoribacter ruber]|uniref:Cyclic nucleotide-binding domain-containing protein n=1 Tax=Litoribacter ruber TaxID=702568 RepID=A0AAP2CFN2_9BACT|nr:MULTISPECIES: cyclic nucleotide-binding domain-containing protein [Litoribacter]MBS9522614.1 cyclic nucleotide-binding domain-containing protein [Litoribacter alkaliphilus]MBT0811143.1 cyclic nucleotide-binding domain-containing protein [Litoribacter ruber]